MSSFDATAIRAANMLSLADILEGHPGGLHINDIAAKANVEAGKLHAILTQLVTRGCFTEGRCTLSFRTTSIYTGR